MQKNISILILLLIPAVFNLSSVKAQIQPKTVTDFYLLLPGEFFSTTVEGKTVKGKANLEKVRRSIIETEDIKNGYLNLGRYSEGWGEVAIFKKKNGTYIVGVAESVCGPGCDGTVKFFTYQNSKWTDVTDEVFPTLNENEIKSAFENAGAEYDASGNYFLLPRVGRTVKMACNLCVEDKEETLLMEFAWNGERFEKKNSQAETTSTNPGFTKICRVTNANGADFYVDDTGETIQLKKGTFISSARTPKVFQGGNIEVKAKVGEKWLDGVISIEDANC